MKRNERILRKHHSSKQLSTGDIMSRRGRSSSHQTHSKILKDESLPSERSLQIDNSMVRHLDSMAESPGNIMPRPLLSENTDASSITMTPRWTNYLDQTYHLRTAKQSRKSLSGDSSVIEGSGNFEDVLESPAKQPHFQHRRRNLIPQNVGTDLFRAAFTSVTPQSSVMLPTRPKGGGEISAEELEEASPVVSQPFKRRRNVMTNPSIFKEAFDDFATASPSSVVDGSNRDEESSPLTKASPQKSRIKTARNKHPDELEEQSDVPSSSASPTRRQTRSTTILPGSAGQTNNAAFNTVTPQSSVTFPTQPNKRGEISVGELEEANPVVSQPFQRRRTVKTNPSIFKEAFKDFATTSPNSVEDGLNRGEESSLVKNTSPQKSRIKKGRNKHPDELEEQSDVPSSSASPTRRQTRSTTVLPGSAGETNNAAFNTVTPQSSITFPTQPNKRGDISVGEFEEANPVVSQPFQRRRTVKTNPSIFKEAFKDFATTSPNSVEDGLNRGEESSLVKNALPQKSRIKKGRNKHPDEEPEEQSDVPSSSASPTRRQTRSTTVLPGSAVQTNNAAFTTVTPQSSVTFPTQPNKRGEISVGELEEANPVVSQPFQRRTVKTNPSIFKEAFKDFATTSPSSVEDGLNRGEESSLVKKASPQKSRIKKGRNKHPNEEPEEQSDVPSSSASPTRRQTRSTTVLPGSAVQTNNAMFTAAAQSSVMLPTQPKVGGEISVEDLEDASPIVSQPFKRRQNVKTNPSVFQEALDNFVTSFPNSVEDVSNRDEESSSLTKASPQKSQIKRARNEHPDELEEQSHVTSSSASPTRRQTRSTTVLPGSAGQTNNAAFTSLTPQSSLILPPHPKGIGEISVEDLQDASTAVAEPFKGRKDVETHPSLYQDAFADFGTSSFNSVEDVSDRREDSRQMKVAHASANASQRNKETGRVHTLVEKSYVPSSSASFNKRQSEMEPVDTHPGVSRLTEQNRVQSTSYGSVKLQNVPWFRRWQERAAAKQNACAFNLLSREDRTVKLQEYVREVKKKYDAFNSECPKTLFIGKQQERENVKVIRPVPKRKVGVKPVRPDLLVDGKPYRPRLKRPKSWATPRLYKLIIAKCEEKYGTLRARRKAEQFVVCLCEKVSTVIRRKKYENYEDILEEIKKALYRLGVIKCLMEYFVFIEDYLPYEYRIKAIPCLRAYGKNTGPPMARDADLFADLNY